MVSSLYFSNTHFPSLKFLKPLRIKCYKLSEFDLVSAIMNTEDRCPYNSEGGGSIREEEVIMDAEVEVMRALTMEPRQPLEA